MFSIPWHFCVYTVLTRRNAVRFLAGLRRWNWQGVDTVQLRTDDHHRQRYARHSLGFSVRPRRHALGVLRPMLLPATWFDATPYLGGLTGLNLSRSLGGTKQFEQVVEALHTLVRVVYELGIHRRNG